jgi:hypothetical protein
MRGRRTRRTFRIGDLVTVRVTGVSVERRQIEFAVKADPSHGLGRRRTR